MDEIIKNRDLEWLSDSELMNLYYMAIETQRSKYIVLFKKEMSRRNAE